MRTPPRGRFRPLILVLSCLLLAGCGIAGQPQAKPFPSFTPRPTQAVATPGSDGIQHVSLEAANDRFVPQSLIAHPGDLVITVRNTDAEVHNLTVFTISEEDVGNGASGGNAVSTGTIKAHQGAVLKVTLTKPGTYKFFCEFHREDGMFGELTIR